MIEPGSLMVDFFIIQLSMTATITTAASRHTSHTLRSINVRLLIRLCGSVPSSLFCSYSTLAEEGCRLDVIIDCYVDQHESEGTSPLAIVSLRELFLYKPLL